MGFWRFVDPATLTGRSLPPTFHHHIAWLSISLAIIGCWSLFPALRRMQLSRSPGSRRVWQLGGALAMGFGFWSMHWTTMLGFQLPVAVTYDGVTALLALVPAVAGSVVAMGVLAKADGSIRRVCLGALCLALGIGAMHYTAMEALQSEATMVYDPAVFAKSLAGGFLATLLALYLNRFLVRRIGSGFFAGLVGATGLALSGLFLHFAAMGATRFYIDGPITTQASASSPGVLMPAIAVSTLLMAGAVWLVCRIDSQLAASMDALIASKARLQSVVDLMPEGLFTADIDGIVQTFNTAAERMFGYSRGEIVGQDFRCLMNVPNRARYSELATQRETLAMYQSGGRMVHPDGGLRRDGATFPIEVRVAPLETDGKRLYSCIVRDLSETWEIDQRMEQLATAVESAHECIAIMNAQREFVYVNRSFETTTGFLSTEVIGHPPRNGACTPEVYAGLWNTFKTEDFWEGRLQSHRSDGSLFEQETGLTAIRNPAGEITAFISVFRDVTARVEAEREHQRLTAAVEHAVDSIKILDPAGRILYINPAFERRTGYRLADIRGSRPESLPGFHPEPAAYAAMLTAISAGKSWSGSMRSTYADGTNHDEEITVSPIIDDAGIATSFVVVKRDVTEQRKLESMLQNSRKLESIGQLAAGIAHEINTPTQYVSDNIRFARDSFHALGPMLAELGTLSATGLPVPADALKLALASADLTFILDEVPKALQDSVEGCERIAVIVKAMKEFSHPGQNKVLVDLNRGIGSTIIVASNEWKYVAEVTTDLDAALPPVVCHAGEINQVILNLLVNAAHAIAEAGGGSPASKGTIGITTRKAGSWAEILVSDTGTGIPADIRDRIFDPFFTTKQVGKGTGQGLALAHDVIVNRHHGEIRVESRVGHGTTFCIRLPLDPLPVETTAVA